jgi:hypothetical protein
VAIIWHNKDYVPGKPAEAPLFETRRLVVPKPMPRIAAAFAGGIGD